MLAVTLPSGVTTRKASRAAEAMIVTAGTGAAPPVTTDHSGLRALVFETPPVPSQLGVPPGGTTRGRKKLDSGERDPTQRADVLCEPVPTEGRQAELLTISLGAYLQVSRRTQELGMRHEGSFIEV